MLEKIDLTKNWKTILPREDGSTGTGTWQVTEGMPCI